MKHRFVFTALVAICLAALGPAPQPLVAQTTNPPINPDASSADSEIRAAAAAFVQSFNQRDASAVAAHWTEDGVYVNEDGERFEGRSAIQSEYETAFANSDKDLRMQLEIDSIRLIGPDTAIEEGRAAVVPQPPGEPRVMSQYTAVHVKKDGKWQMANVRDTRVELPPDFGQPDDLEWLIGTWTTGDKDDHVVSKCQWIENKHFVARSYSVMEAGKETSSGLQIIGVDPSTGQITSWSFASDGGHVVGLWAPHENGWIVASSGATSDGTQTSATQVLSRQDNDTLIWKSENRTLGDVLLPDTQPVVMKRK